MEDCFVVLNYGDVSAIMFATDHVSTMPIGVVWLVQLVAIFKKYIPEMRRYQFDRMPLGDLGVFPIAVSFYQITIYNVDDVDCRFIWFICAMHFVCYHTHYRGIPICHGSSPLYIFYYVREVYNYLIMLRGRFYIYAQLPPNLTGLDHSATKRFVADFFHGV